MVEGYWYQDSSGRIHVVFASSRRIAQWYVQGNSWFGHGATFLKKETRNAQGDEGVTVLAHNADQTLRRSLTTSRLAGASREATQELERLAVRLPNPEVEE